jgi:hypothetical protein
VTVTPVPDNQPPVQTDDEQTFEQYAETMPETAQGFLDAALPQVPPDNGVGDVGFLDESSTMTDDSSTPRKKVNVSKKIRKAMSKFKGKVASVPILWFHNQAKDNPEWELDKDEQELLTDSIETVFEVLDVNFEIEPLSWTLTSVWWVVSYPLLAFLFLFLTKKSMTMDKNKQTEELPS